jgi:hypothetical protein
MHMFSGAHVRTYVLKLIDSCTHCREWRKQKEKLKQKGESAEVKSTPPPPPPPEEKAEV